MFEQDAVIFSSVQRSFEREFGNEPAPKELRTIYFLHIHR